MGVPSSPASNAGRESEGAPNTAPTIPSPVTQAAQQSTQVRPGERTARATKSRSSRSVLFNWVNKGTHNVILRKRNYVGSAPPGSLMACPGRDISRVRPGEQPVGQHGRPCEHRKCTAGGRTDASSNPVHRASSHPGTMCGFGWMCLRRAVQPVLHAAHTTRMQSRAHDSVHRQCAHECPKAAGLRNKLSMGVNGGKTVEY